MIIRTHKAKEEHDFFIQQNKNTDLFIVDEGCLRIKCYFWIFNEVIKFAFIQINAENDFKFNIRVSTEGELLLIDSNQLDLFETADINKKSLDSDLAGWEIKHAEAMGITNHSSCTVVTKPEFMSEENFKAIISAWAGTSNFKVIEGKKLYLNDEEGKDFKKFIDSLTSGDVTFIE